MSDDLDFIAELEARFFADRSVDILDIVHVSASSTQNICLGLEVLFQLREYDFDWLNKQLLRTDLGLTPSAIDSIVGSVFSTAVVFGRSFLGSKLSHVVKGAILHPLRGRNDSVAIGERIHELTLLDRIASGSILTTYRGYRDDGHSFAVRVPNKVPEVGRDAVWHRLRDEFRVLEILSNEGVRGLVRQWKWLDTSYGPVSILDFIDGSVLAEIPTSRISQEVAVGIVQMVASTLAEIHSRGFIHGDVKPENIIVTPDGRAVLLDLNTSLPTDISEIVADRFPGTLNYMSIESLVGGASEVSIQRDIYALGVLLYELLEHRQLTEGTHKEAVFVSQAVNIRYLEDRFTEKTSTALRSVIRIATSLDPDLRFDSCSDLVGALIESQEKPDAEITLHRDPISVAFRLGVSVGEIQYAIRETRRLIAELEEKGIGKLDTQQQLRLLDVVAISEESRVAEKLAAGIGIELPKVDSDGFFLRLPRIWAVHPLKTVDEFRLKLESAHQATQRTMAILGERYLDGKQASAFRLGYLISGTFAEPQFQQLRFEFQDKLKPETFNKIGALIEKTSTASRRKRLQAIANLLKLSLTHSLIG